MGLRWVSPFAVPGSKSHRAMTSVISLGSNYPAGVSACLGPQAPPTIAASGNLEILQGKTLALFCSIKCPGKLIQDTYEFVQKVRNAGVTVIGGFHSPMERECLRILLCSPHPVIVCPARSIPKRMPGEFRRPLEAGRLLLLSPFQEGQSRADEQSAQYRNRFVAALANKIFVAYAAPGSKTELFCREIIGWKDRKSVV